MLGLLAFLPYAAWTLRWEPEHVAYNLNQNQEATEPTEYWGEWDNHTFYPSPSNWRFPFYVLTIDRYVDGDPTNNEANGTVFEHNWMTNQFRFGGDVNGVQYDLDYIQGMGIKVRVPHQHHSSQCTHQNIEGYLPDWESLHQYALVRRHVRTIRLHSPRPPSRRH